MKEEYRVVWQRQGQKRKIKKYTRKIMAERFIALMTSDEPWTLFGKTEDEEVCCSGYQCMCGGETYKEQAAAIRAKLPPLLYARIERRPVGDWCA